MDYTHSRLLSIEVCNAVSTEAFLTFPKSTNSMRSIPSLNSSMVSIAICRSTQLFKPPGQTRKVGVFEGSNESTLSGESTVVSGLQQLCGLSNDIQEATASYALSSIYLCASAQR